MARQDFKNLVSTLNREVYYPQLRETGQSLTIHNKGTITIEGIWRAKNIHPNSIIVAFPGKLEIKTGSLLDLNN